MKKKASYKKIENGGRGSGRGMCFSTRLLLVTLIFALACNVYMGRQILFTTTSAFWKVDSSGKEGVKTVETSGDSGATGSMETTRIRAGDVTKKCAIAYPVDSKEAAEQAVRDAGEKIGLDLSRYEYQCTSIEHNYLMDTYTLNQYYRGLPVLGHVLTMAVDPDGNIRSIIGLEAGVPDSVDESISSVMSHDEARNYWYEYMKKHSGDAAEGAEKTEEGLKILCEDGEDPRLVYVFKRSGETFSEAGGEKTVKTEEYLSSAVYYVDGLTGRVDTFGSMVDTSMAHVNLEGQEGNKRVAADQLGPDTVFLQDTNRHIGIYSYENKGKENEETIRVSPYDSEDIADPAKQSGVDALYNTQRAWQYFARTHARKGFANDDTIFRVYTGLPQGLLDDQAALVASLDGQQYMLIGNSRRQKVQMSAYLDVVGHEYTHGMINQAWKKEFGLSYPIESAVISEGLADIFGELIEDSYDGQGSGSRYDNSCDWVSMGHTSFPRDAKEAGEGQAVSYADLASLADAHEGAGLVSHIAWLLTQSSDGQEEKKWNNLRLGQLFYDAIWSINGFSNMADLRFALENSAGALCRSGRITAAQQKRLTEVLEASGIPAESEDVKISDISAGNGDEDIKASDTSAANGNEDVKAAGVSTENRKNEGVRFVISGHVDTIVYRYGREVLSCSSPAGGEGNAGGQISESGNTQTESTQTESMQTGSMQEAGIQAAAMQTAGRGLVWRRGEGIAMQFYSSSDLEVCLRGRGKTRMKLDIMYPGQGPGNTGHQSFSDLEMTDDTVAYLVLHKEGPALLKIDEDGDGLIDRTLQTPQVAAGQDEKTGHDVREIRDPVSSAVLKMAAAILGLLILVTALPALFGHLSARRKERTGGPVCLQCGMKNRRGARACRRCGKLLPAPAEGHETKFTRNKEKKGGLLPRLILTGLLLVLTFANVHLCRQKGVRTYLEFADNHVATGTYLYKEGLAKGSFQKKLCDGLLTRFTHRLDKDDRVDQNRLQKLQDIVKAID